MPNGMPKQRVHHELHEEVAAHPVGSLVQRLGGDVDPPRPDQADQLLAHAFPVQQHQDRKDDHRERRPERLGERRDELDELRVRRLRRRRDLQRRPRRGIGLLLQVLERLLRLRDLALARRSSGRGSWRRCSCGTPEASRRARPPAFPRRTPPRRSTEKPNTTTRTVESTPAELEALEAARRRREQEGEQDRERKGNQDVAREVEHPSRDQQSDCGRGAVLHFR